eukprot:9237134-Pyramimonas_sp.AAC.1
MRDELRLPRGQSSPVHWLSKAYVEHLACAASGSPSELASEAARVRGLLRSPEIPHGPRRDAELTCAGLWSSRPFVTRMQSRLCQMFPERR